MNRLPPSRRSRWPDEPQALPLPRLPAGAWLLGVLLAGMALGGLSRLIEPHFAPWLLLPLLQGGLVAVAGQAVARGLAWRQRSVMRIGLILAALAVTLTVHLLGYLEYRRAVARAQQLQPWSQMPGLGQSAFQPASLPQFLTLQAQRGRSIGSWNFSGAGTWALWMLDAALVLSGAQVAFGLLDRRPFCSRCRSWLAPMVRLADEPAVRGQLSTLLPTAVPADEPLHGTLWTGQAGCRCGAVELTSGLPPTCRRLWIEPELRDHLLALGLATKS